MGEMDRGNMDHYSGMNHGAMGNMNHSGKSDFHNANFINGRVFDMNKTDVRGAKGRHERWVISGVGDMMLHPSIFTARSSVFCQRNGKCASGAQNGLEGYGTR
ncbi:hypothetical protein KCP71_00815 [Salmonella enterica subsp. enterica]|nr:hypothetical protein KCP71_00815 [Salmonella enterica subsp. enterica]